MRGIRDNSDLGFRFTLSTSTTEPGNVQGHVTRFWKGSVALETRSIPTSLRSCLPYPIVSCSHDFVLLFAECNRVHRLCCFPVSEYVWVLSIRGILQQIVTHGTARMVVHVRMRVFCKVGSGSAPAECECVER